MSESTKPKVVIVGAGWAGLGATYHLAKQGYDVTLLEAGSYPGGLVAGWKTTQGRSVEAGIHGFWYPYRNIFSLVNELGLQPFTTWTRSSQYSPAGLEVESLIFQEQPRLPTPLGTFLYTQFKRLPLSDRLSALPLLYAIIDFDNSHDAWQRYDCITARELFKQYGVSNRLYKDSFEPMLLVGLFAPGEQCSAAAALGMLYYFILAHQADFDVLWCRGTVGERIFRPWVERIEQAGGRVLTHRRVTDLILEDGEDPADAFAFAQNSAQSSARRSTVQSIPQNVLVKGVICGDETFTADAVIFAVGISGMQKIVSHSSTLKNIPEFCNLMNLGAIDVLATRLWCDRKISIPLPSNACFGFDNTTGWTFFDLNALHDEYHDAPGTVVEADFYHANQLLPMSDEQIVAKVHRDLATCIPAFGEAKVLDSSVIRLPRAVTHFSPGSYQSMVSAKTSIANLFMSGDWVITRHGSWSQEKAYVTGLEAANWVCDRFSRGTPATILPIEADEPHIQVARMFNQSFKRLTNPFTPH